VITQPRRANGSAGIARAAALSVSGGSSSSTPVS
jgi:hypothetical protein